MESLYAANTTGLLPFKQDVKDAKHGSNTEHVEYAAEQIEDVHVHDVYLEAHGTISARENRPTESRASFLTLPIELRLKIYEMAYDATYLHSKLKWEGGLKLSFDTSSSSIRLAGSPFTLTRVCRRLYEEVSPMLPNISQVALHFNNFSQETMRSWLALLSDTQISQARSFQMTGWEVCRLNKPLYASGHHWSCHRYRITSNYPSACTASCKAHDGEYITPAKKGLCDRSLSLDLNAFERQFQAERFERMMNQHALEASDQNSQREFHKACYLLRVLDGCVSRPSPKAHPPGRRTQCGSVDGVEAAVASFVSDHGDVVVTRDNIMRLLAAAVGE